MSSAGAPAVAEEGTVAYPADYWSDARIRLKEQIWGPGFVEPGGADYIVNLVQPCGLTSAKSLLDVTARLGGAARTIVDVFDAWITGLEIDPILADKGMAESVRQSVEKKAAITVFDPLGFSLEKRFDVVFAREGFFALPQKKSVLQKLCNAVKPGGELLFTDIARTTQTQTPAYEAWVRAEPLPPRPWTVDHYVSQLKELGMKVRVSADITDSYARMARCHLYRFVCSLDLADHSRDDLMLLLDETEFWTRRIAAFEAGDLTMLRLFAMKSGTSC